MSLGKDWRLILEDCAKDPVLGYALDTAIAERVGEGTSPPTVRIWRPGRCLALGRFDVRLPRYREAVSHLRSQGIVVLRRQSGGQAVWQDPHFVNVSVIAPQEKRLGIPEAYRIYLAGVQKGLSLLGVETAFRHVEGAFCGGPDDLAVGGRKLLGTAQIQKRGMVVVHGTMPVWGGLPEMIHWVSAFYARAGRSVRLREEAMVTLAELLDREIAWEELEEGLVEGHRKALGPLVPQAVSTEERARAEALRKTLAPS